MPLSYLCASNFLIAYNIFVYLYDLLAPKLTEERPGRFTTAAAATTTFATECRGEKIILIKIQIAAQCPSPLSKKKYYAILSVDARILSYTIRKNCLKEGLLEPKLKYGLENEIVVRRKL